MRTNKTAREVIESLTQDENLVVSRWAWPADIPDSDQLYVRFVTEAQVAPGGLTLDNLNLAVGNYRMEMKEASTAWKAFAPTIPAGLRGPDGQLTEFNLNALYRILDENFERITQGNLAAALKIGTEQRAFQWKQVADSKPGGIKTTITGLVNHAAQTSGDETKVLNDWYKTVPEELFSPDGSFGANLAALFDVLQEPPMNGKVTVLNLDVALKLLKSRGKLIWYTQPKTQEEKVRDAELKKYREGIESDTDNIRHPSKTTDVAKLLAEANAVAVERVEMIRKASSPKTQSRIDGILSFGLKNKIEPVVSLNEITALLSIERAHAGAGASGTHSTAKVLQDGIDEVLQCELQHAANSGDVAIMSSVYTRSAHRVETLLKTGVSSGPGRGVDANGYQEVRTGIVGSRSIQ